jgi:murein L,D-transpeptidase YafK
LTEFLHNAMRLNRRAGKLKNLIQMIRRFKNSPSSGIIRRYPLSILLFILIPLLSIGPAHADSVKQSINQKLPTFLLEWDSEPDYVIAVDKSQQKVMVYRTDNLLVPEKVYMCTTGENDGPKTKKNDRKTPEGIYFFTKSYVSETLSPIYGSRALPINYPNLIDQMEGKEGYGIWFHGTNKPIIPNDTNGCISFENKDIEELATLIKVFETPIIISSRIEMASPADIEKEKEEITEIIENWRTAWQDRDIERYMSFYNRNFSSGGKNWREWKKNKSRIADKINHIIVDVDDLRLLTADGVVLATFKQTYSTPEFTTRGKKMLYLTKNSDQWKILVETFDLDKIEKIEMPAAELAKVETPAADTNKIKIAIAEKQEAFSLKDVEDFIYSWKDAWEKEDLDRYISCYDMDFKSRGMDLAAWKEHRKALNEKYQSLTIEIGDLKIMRISDNSAKATFMQDYMADSYEDIGNKQLFLIKTDKDWKIKEEEWTQIKKR